MGKPIGSPQGNHIPGIVRDCDVDDQLIGAGLHQAAIIGHDGNVWAQSAGFGLKPGEGAALVTLFKNPANVFASGVTINGVKYMGIKGEDTSIYGKKGAGGLVTVKTGQSVLIGVYNETLQPGPAVNIVEKLGDYLKENGY